jgi:hypothetical protein
MYTLGAAARATGKSKATISRAIKAGRLSAARDDDGGYAIDPSELHRVYPATGVGNGAAERYATPGATGPHQSFETVALQRLLADREETIRDLRARLDAEAEERRRVQAQLTALLSDKRELPTVETPPLATWPRRVLRWLAKQHV